MSDDEDSDYDEFNPRPRRTNFQPTNGGPKTLPEIVRNNDLTSLQKFIDLAKSKG